MTPSASDDCRMTQAADSMRLDAIAEMADLAASYWRSIGEAAFRGERNLVEMHCRQAAVVTREAFVVVKTLGAPADREVA